MIGPGEGGGLRGAVAWALVPSVSELSPRLWNAGRACTDLPGVESFARRVRDGELAADQTILTRAALGPVLLLQDRPRGVLRELVALRTVCLIGLSDAQQRSIREQRESSLFHLPLRPTKYGLGHEVAVDLNGLTRIHISAMLPRLVGRLDDNEMRVVGQRLVDHLDIDLEPLVAHRVEQRLEQLAMSR